MLRRARNVLLILTDQQRKDTISAYGNPGIRTPNLDRLAARGVRFERAYCQNPFCCPSRASILTGLYPRTHGVWNNSIPFSRVGAPTLGDLLHEHGYRTGSVGKIHLNPWGPPPPVGFEESRQYWAAHPEMRDWHGPYCGFRDVEMSNGHVHYSTTAGHYGAYLAEKFPAGVELFKRKKAIVNHAYFETWRNAMPEEHHYNTWIADDNQRKSFWAWATDSGMSHDDVHTALGVDSLKTYTGTKRDAAAACGNWIKQCPFEPGSVGELQAYASDDPARPLDAA